MTDVTHRTVPTNGISMHIAEAGSGPLVVLLHGFPELWYSWRHQLSALADHGYHAVAPDVRGYGGTDAPKEIEAYSMKQMTADVAGLLDALDERQAVVVGHDWGAPIAWHTALLYPERVRAVVGMSVPYLPRSVAPPLQMLDRIFADRFFYILYFQKPGVAEAELEADVRRSIRIFMFAASGEAPWGQAASNKPRDSKLFDGMPDTDKLPPWLTEADQGYYVGEFERTGFRGGLNRYRCMDLDWEQLPELAGAKITQPALFVTGERDPVAAFTTMEGMQTGITDLRKVVKLPGCGHWTQQERPEEVNRELIEFLRGL